MTFDALDLAARVLARAPELTPYRRRVEAMAAIAVRRPAATVLPALVLAAVDLCPRQCSSCGDAIDRAWGRCSACGQVQRAIIAEIFPGAAPRPPAVRCA